MSKVKIQGNASGTGVVTLTAPNTNTDRVITLPDSSDTLVSTAPGTSGNILTSDGTNWTSAAPAAGGADTSLSNLSATGENRVASAWVYFNGTGTLSVKDSYNVSSVSDLGVGQYRMNFTTAMTNNLYCVATGGGAGGVNLRVIGPYNYLTTSVDLNSTYAHASVYDTDYANVVIFGD